MSEEMTEADKHDNSFIESLVNSVLGVQVWMDNAEVRDKREKLIQQYASYNPTEQLQSSFVRMVDNLIYAAGQVRKGRSAPLPHMYHINHIDLSYKKREIFFWLQARRQKMVGDAKAGR